MNSKCDKMSSTSSSSNTKLQGKRSADGDADADGDDQNEEISVRQQNRAQHHVMMNLTRSVDFENNMGANTSNGDEMGEINTRSTAVMIDSRPQGEYSGGQNSQNLQLLPENTITSNVSRPQQIQPSVVSQQQQILQPLQPLQSLPMSVTHQIPVMSSFVNQNPSVSASRRSANVSMTTNTRQHDQYFWAAPGHRNTSSSTHTVSSPQMQNNYGGVGQLRAQFIPSSASGGIASSSTSSTGQNFQMQNNYGGVGQLRAQFTPRSASNGGIAVNSTGSSSLTGQNSQYEPTSGQNFQHQHQVQNGGGSTPGGIYGNQSIPGARPGSGYHNQNMAARSSGIASGSFVQQQQPAVQVQAEGENNMFHNNVEIMGNVFDMPIIPPPNPIQSHPEALCDLNRPLGSHLSQALVNKIINSEYIEFASLLQNNSVTSNSDSSSGLSLTFESGRFIWSGSKSRPVPNIYTWSDAFLTFSAIFLGAHPSRTQELLKYGNIVRTAHARHGGYGWRDYDVQFRLTQMRYPNRAWGFIDQELWTLCILSPVAHHGLPSHAVREGSHNFHSSGQRRGGKSGSSRGGQGVCYAFNDQSGCKRDSCRYLHKCKKCHNSGHGAFKCKK